MSKIKIVGIGSPFGSDSIGLEAVDALMQCDILRNLIPNSIMIEALDRPGVRLLDAIKAFDEVILIDAVMTGQSVGTIHKFANNDIMELRSMLSTHDIGVAQALQLGKELNMLPKNIILYGVEIDIKYLQGGYQFANKDFFNDLIDKVAMAALTLVKS